MLQVGRRVVPVDPGPFDLAAREVRRVQDHGAHGTRVIKWSGARRKEAHGERSVGNGGAMSARSRVPAGPVVAVAAGGALGAPARHAISLAVDISPGTFPWGTFWTNVSGSFALGCFLALVLARFPPTRFLRPFVATGFIGSYTTYSTFAVETDLLVENGRLGVAMAYVVASVAAGVAAAWAGALLGGVRRTRRTHA